MFFSKKFSIARRYFDVHSKIMVIGLISIYITGIIIGTDFLRCEPWGDELHYLETVRMFVNSFSLQTLMTYPEMHPPLIYMLYASVGKIMGDYNWVYRLFTLCCAAITFFSIFQVLKIALADNLKAILGLLVFMINPYVIGLSVFVFNDMPGMMFLTLAVLAALYKKPALFCLASAAAILSRQYLVFGPFALALWGIYSWFRTKNNYYIKLPVYALLSLVPICLVFLYWGDIAPPEGMAQWNPERVQGFHPEFIVVYLTLIPVYAAPCIVYCWRRLASLRLLGISYIAGLTYWFFPITPTKIATDAGVYTIGFFHKMLRSFNFGSNILEHFIFGASDIFMGTHNI